MENRLATKADLDAIMALVGQAQAFMKACGLDQWQDGYPRREIFEEDIARGRCHVLTEGKSIAAAVTVSDAPEDCYQTVYGGAWLTENTPYAVVHRSLVGNDYRGMRLGERLLSLSENVATGLGSKSVRVDTHRDNLPMRRTLENCGYTCCGRVYLEGPEKPRYERVVYEKRINPAK